MADESLMGEDQLGFRNIVIHNHQLKESTSICHKLKGNIQRFCSIKTLKKRVPCINWIPEYNFTSFIGDLVAGLTVALLIIPQALAYGLVAGLTPNYGLYSAFMGSFVYFILGSTRELSIGPTAIMSLMTLHYSSQGGADYAVLLCFTSGCIELLSGIFNLGFLINFISEPVISGFISAAAVTIASSQLKGLFGLKIKTKSVIDTWYQLCTNIGQTHWPDMVLGLICVLLLTFMKYMRNIKCGQKFMNKSLFLLSVGRNAFIVLISSVIAFSYSGDNQPFTLTGEVTAGLPPLSLPPFSTTVNNQTMAFTDILGDIGIGIIMVPFIAILDTIAVVSASSKGKPFDATQEIIALGVINILASFFSSLPTTASLSRTAINKTSGVCTPAGGLVTGCIVLLALVFLTPFFKYIPKATLSAVIICAVIAMVEYELVMPIWKSKKIELIPFVSTFFACLFIGLEWGLLLGIALHLSMMLLSYAKPTVHVAVCTFPKSGLKYVFVTPTNGINFPNSDHIRSAITKAGLITGQGIYPVIINCAFLKTMDFTSAKGLKGTISDFESRNQPIIFLHLQLNVLRVVESMKIPIATYESLVEVEEHFKTCNEQLNKIDLVD